MEAPAAECVATEKAEEEDGGGGHVKEQQVEDETTNKEEILEVRTESETRASEGEVVALEDPTEVEPEKEKAADDEKVSEEGDVSKNAGQDQTKPLFKDESAQEERRWEETEPSVRPQVPDEAPVEAEIMEVEISALAESEETVKTVDNRVDADKNANEKEGDGHEREAERGSEVHEAESAVDHSATSGNEDEAQGNDLAVVEETPDANEKLELEEEGGKVTAAEPESEGKAEEEKRPEKDDRAAAAADLFSRRRRALREKKVKLRQRLEAAALRTERRAQMLEAAAHKPVQVAEPLTPEAAKLPSPAKRCRVLPPGGPPGGSGGEGEAAAAVEGAASSSASVVVDVAPPTTPTLIIREALFSQSRSSPSFARQKENWRWTSDWRNPRVRQFSGCYLADLLTDDDWATVHNLRISSVTGSG